MGEGEFASRFAAALNDYRTHGDDYADLACTLFKLQPFVALDEFLGKPNPKRNFGFRARFVANHGPVVQCAPEDILLQKLRWYRLGSETSDRQWRDVLGIVRVQAGRLDAAYLRRGATILGVEDLLTKAMSEG